MAAVTGTTLMTSYSYALSSIKDRNFREPELLGNMLWKLAPAINKKPAWITGWLLHYTIGVVFTTIYNRLVKKYRPGPSVKSQIVIGLITGLAAIAGWHITKGIHPDPPNINYKKFYGQLLIAHIIFAIVAISILRKYSEREQLRHYR